MEAGQIWRQYIIAGIANLGIVSTGYTMGWTSPMNGVLKNSTDSPLSQPITTAEESWIGSLLTIGAMFGPFAAGVVISKIGRKWGLTIAAIPFLIGWAFIATATNVGLLYTGRIFQGIATGMIFTISPIYCAEIATDAARGALGSFLQVFVTLGFLSVYCVGSYTSYNGTAYIAIGVLTVFAVTFSFMPETPIYHLGKNNREAAAECLAKIRGKSRTGVEAELDKMAAEVAAAYENSATLADVFKGNNLKALYIACALITTQQLCGINAVLFYMNKIFNEAKTNLDPAVATIITGAIQFGASCVTPFVVDRLGRRILLMVSSFGTAVGLAGLGFYFALHEYKKEVAESIGFVPLLCLILFIVTFPWGLGAIPFAVLGELMPIEVKNVASPICTLLVWVLCFVVTRFFAPIGEAIGMFTVFWIFGMFCVISFFFALFYLPETKGKSFQEIQDILAGRTRKPEKA